MKGKLYMFELSLDQTKLFNCGIEFFCLCIILLMYYNSKRELSFSYDFYLLRRVQVLTMSVLVSDIIMWATNGYPGKTFWYIGYISNVVYFVIQILITISWLNYVSYRLYRRKVPTRIRIPLITIPVIIITALTLSSPWTSWVFYIDSSNYYHRGPLSDTLAVITLAYLMGTSLLGLIKMHREVLLERRKECLAIALFIVPPLIGGILQMLNYGGAFLFPCITLSLLMIFMDIESQAISIDALTGLNNRGKMDNYLNSLMVGNNRAIALIMIDINDFKIINDDFGHDKGDEILVFMADILKKTFGNSSAFLARYGGDEFVVILENLGTRAVANYMAKIKENIDVFNSSVNYGFELSVGIGHAIYPSKKVNNADDLFRIADEEMYRDKVMFKERLARGDN